MNTSMPEAFLVSVCAAYITGALLERLRELLAEDVNRAHGTSYGLANVAVQPGGKPVIGKFTGHWSSI